MSPKSIKKPHILFLFSDTGGGHRSAATAIIEALNLEFPQKYSTEMVDFFVDYAPLPLNYAGPTYPAMSKAKWFWSTGYKILDNKNRMDAIYDFLWPYVRRAADRLFTDHPCDVIVSVHSLVNSPVLHSPLRKVPYITVVVDLVTAPTAWYQPEADLMILPTIAAYEKGIHLGMDPHKMKLVGLPIADKYCHSLGSRRTIRKRLDWDPDLPAILLVGGGEGMGMMEENAYALDDAHVPAMLTIVCGKNKKMRARLEEYKWCIPVKIYGFVNQLEAFMQASNMIITKAGPTTICESYASGLPIIISSHVPGQEEGNVHDVVNSGAGVWAPTSERVVNIVSRWLDNPDELKKVAKASRDHARPQASRDIARLITSFIK
jgi:1,2-diacylglycerol 3-beta-galactosyltransferase